MSVKTVFVFVPVNCFVADLLLVFFSNSSSYHFSTVYSYCLYVNFLSPKKGGSFSSPSSDFSQASKSRSLFF